LTTSINNREIIFVQYSTEKNWLGEIPNCNWLCILVVNDKPRRYIDEVISKIINKDVCYVCTVGKSCELTHDLIDEEIVFREVDIDNLHLLKHDIITTWHPNIVEGIEFAVLAANHDQVRIEKIVILDMTDGQENEQIHRVLSRIQLNEK
jgi:hypothetical protein